MLKTYQLILFTGLVACLLVLITVTVINKQADSFLFECASNSWNNITLHGDFAGELNCLEYWDSYYERNWNKICSLNPFSDRPDCHTLCNYDCEVSNKKGEGICVC